MTEINDLPAIVDRLQARYEQSVHDLKAALKAYLETGARPALEDRLRGLFAYPEIRLTYQPEPGQPMKSSRGARSYGRLTDPGLYALSVTRPAFFRAYLIEQLGHLVRDYNVEIAVGPSEQEIPYPYVLDATQDLGLDAMASREVARWFPTTDLAGIGDETAEPERAVADAAWRRHQMPAYHLMAEGGAGITLVNIGVGPSNAKTICDHIAVLRPHVWLMIGHCGGLRPSQSIGDYVLAHAYLRDDHLLDDVLPPEVPLPVIAEVQKALFEAALTITGEDEDSVKQRLRTGTVVTTDDRNWELRYAASALRFNQSRAVAIDMESATVAAQGYRFRVPYGTLLCVSDKPLHGELKLPGQANAFYERAISQHLRIGIEALGLLQLEGEGLHSRKLRSFDEPPLR